MRECINSSTTDVDDRLCYKIFIVVRCFVYQWMSLVSLFD